MTNQVAQLKGRTKQFAIRIIRLFRSLPRTEEVPVIGKQVLRSGISVATNYRAVCRARSKVEFTAKRGVVLEEIDEAVLCGGKDFRRKAVVLRGSVPGPLLRETSTSRLQSHAAHEVGVAGVAAEAFKIKQPGNAL